MARGPRALLFTASLLLTACNAVLGLREIDEASPALEAAAPTGSSDGGSSSDARIANDDGPHDAAVDGSPSGFCAAYPGALLCDDFESGKFAKGWQVIKDANGFALVNARTGAVDGGTNQWQGYFGFSSIPATGVSVLSVPMANGRRSLRFEVNPPLNGWPGTGVGLAGMVDATQNGLRILAEQNDAGAFKYAVRTTDGTLVTDIGYVVQGLWACLEIEVGNDGTVKAWQGTALSVGSVPASFATTPLLAEVGMIWLGPGNPSGSKYVRFDNVVVGTGAVGCP